MPRKLVVLGCTGSIGQQALDVVRALPGRFEIVGLAGGSNLAILQRQVTEFQPRYVYAATKSSECSFAGSRYMPMEEMASLPDLDLVLVATVGTVGLKPTLAALAAGNRVAIANKEVLVMAGELVAAEARAHHLPLLPVDSEHSAIWQCLRGEVGESWAEFHPSVSRLLLTASGGAFRDWQPGQLREVTPEQALAHPNWRMGPKVTVDSATLMNKGFEAIEAHWLFGVPYDRIDVVLHRESIVHSLVEFVDGSLKAQLASPDMRLPIQYALTYPDRLPSPVAPLDLASLGRLTFGEIDRDRYPCFQLALQAAAKGGAYPAVLSAADEEAVRAFLAGSIAFTDIAGLVSSTLEAYSGARPASLDEIMDVDAWARAEALAWVSRHGR